MYLSPTKPFCVGLMALKPVFLCQWKTSRATFVYIVVIAPGDVMRKAKGEAGVSGMPKWQDIDRGVSHILRGRYR